MTAKPRRCITVLYPNTPGVIFDFDYYLKHHATLIDRLVSNLALNFLWTRFEHKIEGGFGCAPKSAEATTAHHHLA
jgi:hypothetical protein